MDRGLHSDDVTTTRFLAILHVHVTCHAVTCCFMVYACHRMSRFFTIRISGFANFVPEKYTPKMAKKVTFYVKTPLKVTLGRFQGGCGHLWGLPPWCGPAINDIIWEKKNDRFFFSFTIVKKKVLFFHDREEKKKKKKRPITFSQIRKKKKKKKTIVFTLCNKVKVLKYRK